VWHPLRVRVLTLSVFGAIAIGCGGIAVVDPTDGSGGASSTTSSSSSSGTTTTGPCVPLNCNDVGCGFEAPDGCGGMIFCGCELCSVTRGPQQIVSAGSNESNRSWDGPSNAILSDDNYAEIDAMIFGDVSELLLAWELGFDLPSDAFVVGVEANVERRASAGVGLVDHQVSLIVDGTVGSENKALPGEWAANEETASYGGSADMWGVPRLPLSDVNDPQFGVAFGVRYDQMAGNDWALVDAITVTVHFSAQQCP
jgi:hypothetical protein